MTKIKTVSPQPFHPNMSSRREVRPHHLARQPSIKDHRNEQPTEFPGRNQDPAGPMKQEGFIDTSAATASAGRNVVGVPRQTVSALEKGISMLKGLGVKLPAGMQSAAPHLKFFGVQGKIIELPLRTLTTIKDIKDKDLGNGLASGTKLAATATEMFADVGSLMIPTKKGAAPSKPPIALERAHPPGSHQIPRAVLRRPGRPGTSAPSSQTSKPPSVHSSQRPLRPRAKPSSPPRNPAPQPSARVPAKPLTSGTSTLSTTLSRIGNGAKVIGGGLDLYFGTKQALEQREGAGKAQGILTAGSGAAGLGSGAASLAGASTVSAGLGVASASLAVVSIGMSAVPAIHGRDNKNRAVKLYNDVSHEVRQMEEADKHLLQRNVDLRPTLEALEQRYGIQTRNVWLNNNAADFLNQVNSPNNTTSGQWKPDADSKTWSSFSGKYVQIEGTPHEDEVVLHLPSEKDGAPLRSAAHNTTVTVAGDDEAEKHPTELTSFAADPARHSDEDWHGSQAQAPVSKRYGYKTSSWGQHWESNVPFALDAGPLYLSKSVSKCGQDTVVLIDDTAIERPDTPVPASGYTEGALFAHDGQDGQRLTARQVASLLLKGKPATINDTFNVTASPEKAEENAYREAAYPVKEGTSYIRSPDEFKRRIVTTAAHRTVVSLQNVTHPVRIDLLHERDILDAPSMVPQDLLVSLPPLPAGADDQRRLGIPEEQAKPIFEKHYILSGRGGRKAIHASTYIMGNGATLTVQSDDRLRIERFMRTIPG